MLNETSQAAGVDLVVVNYKTPGDLREFCRSVINHEPTVPWTLTVVNVSPTVEDLTVGMWAESWGAIHLSSAENIGYARACNTGASHGALSVIALLNADVRLTAGAVDDCAQALMAHPTWGVLGPRQVDDRGLVTHAGIFGERSAPKHRAWLTPDSAVYADVVPAVTVSGAAYFIKRSVWDELTACPQYRAVATADGAFLPTPHYFEETYCSYHALEHGYEVIYYGPVCIIHRWHQASQVGGWAEKQFPISQALFRYACDAHSIPHD